MSDQKVFKFGFSALLLTLKLGLKFPCNISIIWKRGQKLAEVHQRRQIINGVATFNEQLTIQCNMLYSVSKKQFEPKKTIFTVLIFTDKGTKQAGEVEVDVSQLLNNRQEETLMEVPLTKCPDKNASLSFKIKGQVKEEIRLDMISQSSFKTVDIQKVAGTINSSTANFKKKDKVEYVGPFPQTLSLNTYPQTMSAIQLKRQTSVSPIDGKMKDLQDLNKKLKEQIKQQRKESQKLKKASANYQKSFDEMQAKMNGLKQELQKVREKHKGFKSLETQNRNLECEVLACRIKLASIFNAAYEIGGPELADELQEAGLA